MATTSENTAAIQAILNNVTEFSALTGAERNAIKGELYPEINGYRTDKGSNENYSQHEVGDIISHIDQATKTQLTGVVLQVPFSIPADFSNPLRFDKYQENIP